jgi:hypothetical protein
MSNSLIGSLSILTQVDNAKLSKGFKEAESPISKFVGSIGKIGLSLGAAGVATFGISQIVAGFKEGFGELDRLSAKAEAIGTSVNALSSLGHAAVMTDVEIGSLEAGLGKLVRNLGEALTGSKEQVAAFKAIGLEAEDLRGLDTAELFEVVAEELSKIPDLGIRSARGVDLFGKSFQDLLPLINKGAEGIRGFREEAEAIGLTFSSQELANLAVADQAFTRLEQKAKGLKLQAVAKLAGPMAWLAEQTAGISIDDLLIAPLALLSPNMAAAARTALLLNNELDDQADFAEVAARAHAGAVDEIAREAAAMRKAADEAAKLTEKVEGLRSALWDDLFSSGMSSDEKKLEELIRAGASPEDIGQLRNIIRLKKEAEEEKKLFDRRDQAAKEFRDAKRREREQLEQEHQAEARAAEDRINSLREEARSEEEIWKEKLRFIRAQVQAGNISFREGGELAAGVNKEFEASRRKNDMPFAGAALWGSEEARDTLLRGSVADGTNPWVGIQKNTTTQVAEAKKTNGFLRELVNKKPKQAKI